MIVIIEDNFAEITTLHRILVEDQEIREEGVLGYFVGTQDKMGQELAKREPLGFSVSAGVNVEAIVDILAENNVTIIIVDQVLSGYESSVEFSGIDLIRRAKHIFPDIICILYTGKEISKEIVPAINEKLIFYYIRKLRDGANEVRSIVKSALRLREAAGDAKAMAGAYSTALEYRDAYTGSHSHEVESLCQSMMVKARDIGRGVQGTVAEYFKLRKNVATAALLHDIGKIAIREGIIAKPGKLTEEERSEIETHSILSANMLMHFPVEVQEYVRHHHERYDGTGYPSGLIGVDIPYGARVIAIADSFHAMTSRRPYRSPLDKSLVIDELRVLSGELEYAHWYDRDLVECLDGVLKERRNISLGEHPTQKHYCRSYFLLLPGTFCECADKVVNEIREGVELPHTIGAIEIRDMLNEVRKDQICEKCRFSGKREKMGCHNNVDEMRKCRLYGVFSEIKRMEGIIRVTRLEKKGAVCKENIQEELVFIVSMRLKDSYVLAKNRLFSVLRIAGYDGHVVLRELNREVTGTGTEIVEAISGALQRVNGKYHIDVVR